MTNIHLVDFSSRDTSSSSKKAQKSIFRASDTNTALARSVLEAEATSDSSMSGFWIDFG